MSELSLEQKKAQFDEYFSIAHRINANMRPLGEDEVVPDEENLEESMPYAFRIASAKKYSAPMARQNLPKTTVIFLPYLFMVKRTFLTESSVPILI